MILSDNEEVSLHNAALLVAVAIQNRLIKRQDN